MIAPAVVVKESFVVEGCSAIEKSIVHKSSVCHLPVDTRILVAKALMSVGEFDYDLVKISKDEKSVTLFRYPDFDTNPHPALKYSITVILSNGQFYITDYSKSKNPPILHRKESFIAPTHPRYEEFSQLTQAEEKAGLFNRFNIGNRKQWKALLVSKNLTIKGHSLIEIK